MRDYTIFIPELIAAGAAVAIIALELAFPKIRKDLLADLTALAALGLLGASCAYIGMDPNNSQGPVQLDNFMPFARILSAGIVAVIALMSARYLRDRTSTAAEYYRSRRRPVTQVARRH